MPPQPRRKSRLGRSPAEPRPDDDTQDGPQDDTADSGGPASSDRTENDAAHIGTEGGKQGSKVERKQASKHVSNDDADADRDDTDQRGRDAAPQLQWGADAILGGGVDPEEEFESTGWKALGYVKDAVRLQAATSRNREERKLQRLVSNALKAYLSDEVLDQAYYYRHGRQRPHL